MQVPWHPRVMPRHLGHCATIERESAMQSNPARAPRTCMTVVGSLALASALLLAGCGGSSAEPSASAAASSEAMASGPAIGSGDFDPPRPTGVPDSDWAAYLTTWDPTGFMEGSDEEILAEYCAKDEATVREETIGGLPENAAAEYPDSTLQEWTAFFDYSFARLEEHRQQLCANQG